MIFTEQHELIRKLARDFTETEIEPVANDIDKTGEFPKEILEKMAEAGFYGIKMPKEYGGGGSDNVGYTIVMEEICKSSAVAGVYISSPNSLLGSPFLLVGTEEQKQEFLVPMIKGEKNLVFALTEPGAGSDAGAVSTSAIEDGDDYILNGRKTFITGAPISDHMIVFAKTDFSKGSRGITTFIVDSDQEGVSFGKEEDKMGIVGCPTSDIILDNVRVPKSRILGEVNEGFITAMQTLSVGRLGIAAQSIGIAQRALDEAIEYSKQRNQFGRPIAKLQGIQFMLADMATKLDAARLLTYRAAYLMDQGINADKEASMAKYFAAETAIEIVDDALQIHGGYGYIKDYTIERLYRDVRITSIYEGTSQIQQVVIASNLLK